MWRQCSGNFRNNSISDRAWPFFTVTHLRYFRSHQNAIYRWKYVNYFATFCHGCSTNKTFFTYSVIKGSLQTSKANPNYTLHSIHYTVYIIQYTLHSIHYTVYITQYTLYSIHYTVYITQYTFQRISQREIWLITLCVSCRAPLTTLSSNWTQNENKR
jgi:hypothetical protein